MLDSQQLAFMLTSIPRPESSAYETAYEPGYTSKLALGYSMSSASNHAYTTEALAYCIKIAYNDVCR